MQAIAGITKISCDPHQKGLIELSRLRYRNTRPRTASDNSLLQIIHSRVHINAIGGLSPSSIDVNYDVEGVEVPPRGTGIWRIMRRTSRCCIATQRAISASSKQTLKSEAIKSLDDLFSAYIDLLNWGDALPSTWSYKYCKMPSSGNSALHNYPEKYYIFKDIQHGAMWLSFWCNAIYALQTHIRGTSHPVLGQCFDREKYSTQYHKKRLYSAVDDICACVPYMLGEVDCLGLPTAGGDSKALGAFFLLRGLYVASCVTEVSTLQREYMNTTFLRIAHGKGIKLALRPRSRWLNQQQKDSVGR